MKFKINSKTKCPICDYQIKECQCFYSGSAHPDRSKQIRVVLDHLYILDKKQLKHIIKLQRFMQTSYEDDERTKILEGLKRRMGE